MEGGPGGLQDDISPLSWIPILVIISTYDFVSTGIIMVLIITIAHVIQVFGKN